MGIGNLLMGDDGLGIHAVRLLGKVELPENVELMDAGTAFIDAVDRMGKVENLVIIDAVKGGKRPGTVYRFTIDPDSHEEYSPSIHGLSVISTMKFALAEYPCSVCVLGIEPGVIDWSMELSGTVTRAMPILIDAVLNEIGCIQGPTD
jgi:hydrogenase maturation protease